MKKIICTIGIFLFMSFLCNLGWAVDIAEDVSEDVTTESFDRNDDGIDDQLVRLKDGIPLSWEQDNNHDGIVDNWAYFRGGYAFLDESDIDQDGNVDLVSIVVYSEDGLKVRTITLQRVQVTEEQALFFEKQDSGWNPVKLDSSDE